MKNLLKKNTRCLIIQFIISHTAEETGRIPAEESVLCVSNHGENERESADT